MKKHLLSFVVCVVGLTGVTIPGFAQLGPNDYTVTRRAEINLQGESISYPYTVDRMEGRFNRQLKRFEFRMPLQAVQPARIAADIIVLKSVFRNSPDAIINPSDLLQLWVYVPENTRDFQNFRNAQTLTLPADFIINGNVYRTSVAMNLFYSAGTLKYGIGMNMDAGLETVSSVNFVGGPLRNLQMLVPESEMQVLFNE